MDTDMAGLLYVISLHNGVQIGGCGMHVDAAVENTRHTPYQCDRRC